MFQKSWIPAINSAGYRQFQLFDLAMNPGRQTDLSAEFPNTLAKLKKKLHNINMSVMADAPEW